MATARCAILTSKVGMPSGRCEPSALAPPRARGAKTAATLLDMLAIAGAIVTIDAMGCQRDIAQKILDNKADYVLALKGNQGSLREDGEGFVAEQQAAGFKDTQISQDRTIDG